jgi:hypothetical protein
MVMDRRNLSKNEDLDYLHLMDLIVNGTARAWIKALQSMSHVRTSRFYEIGLLMKVVVGRGRIRGVTVRRGRIPSIDPGRYTSTVYLM